jgi:hypothetical protein
MTMLTSLVNSSTLVQTIKSRELFFQILASFSQELQVLAFCMLTLMNLPGITDLVGKLQV